MTEPAAPAPNAETYPGMFSALTDFIGNFADEIRTVPVEAMRKFLEDEIAPLFPGQPLQPNGKLYGHVVVLDVVPQLVRLLHETGVKYRAAVERHEQDPALPDADADKPAT